MLREAYQKDTSFGKPVCRRLKVIRIAPNGQLPRKRGDPLLGRAQIGERVTNTRRGRGLMSRPPPPRQSAQHPLEKPCRLFFLRETMRLRGPREERNFPPAFIFPSGPGITARSSPVHPAPGGADATRRERPPPNERLLKSSRSLPGPYSRSHPGPRAGPYCLGTPEPGRDEGEYQMQPADPPPHVERSVFHKG